VYYAQDVDQEPLIFTERGRPVVALISVRDADAESLGLSMNPKFLAIVERSRRCDTVTCTLSPRRKI
jgi:PHD/YefM family antitoxin component YafN of YafNO toxin-antitoxin module